MTSIRLKQSDIHATVMTTIMLTGIFFHLSDDFQIQLDSSVFAADGTLKEVNTLYPDAQVSYHAPGGYPRFLEYALFALEIGFSQPIEEVEERVRRLLRMTAIKTCIMFVIEETPHYRNPFKRGVLETCKANIETYASQRQKTSPDNSVHKLDSDSRCSPVLIHGVQWVGEMTGVVQVFVKDSETGEAVERTKKMVGAFRAVLSWT